MINECIHNRVLDELRHETIAFVKVCLHKQSEDVSKEVCMS